MASPNVLAGIASGGGVIQGFDQGQQRAQRNELAQFQREDRQRQSQLLKAFPAAVSGDQNALALVAQSDPQTFMGLQTHHAKLAEAKRLEQQQRVQQFAGASLYGLDMVRKAPAEQRKALYQQTVRQLQQLDPETFQQLGGAPEQYDEAFVQAVTPRLLAVALGPEGMAKYASGQVGEKADKGPDPYYTQFSTPDGMYRFNNRTGQAEPLTGKGGSPLTAAKDSPELAGDKARATATGKAEGELEAEKGKKVYNAKEALVVLNEIEKLLPHATGSGAGAAVDATARFFGGTTDGAKAARRLKVLAPQLILKIPRMEGPQSDKDTMLYREAAGNLGDETLTTDERMEALQTLKMLNEKYAHQNIADTAAPQASDARGGWSIRVKGQ